MAPIPSKTHTAGEAFGWQMPPRGHQEGKARWLPATNNLERLKCKLFERVYVYMYIYIYIIYNVCIQNTLNGIVVKTLQCWAFVWECGTSWISYMSDSCFIEPSKWPADQDAWFALQSEGCILLLSKFSKS